MNSENKFYEYFARKQTPRKQSLPWRRIASERYFFLQANFEFLREDEFMNTRSKEDGDL